MVVDTQVNISTKYPYQARAVYGQARLVGAFSFCIDVVTCYPIWYRCRVYIASVASMNSNNSVLHRLCCACETVERVDMSAMRNTIRLCLSHEDAKKLYRL